MQSQPTFRIPARDNRIAIVYHNLRMCIRPNSITNSHTSNSPLFMADQTMYTFKMYTLNRQYLLNFLEYYGQLIKYTTDMLVLHPFSLRHQVDGYRVIVVPEFDSVDARSWGCNLARIYAKKMKYSETRQMALHPSMSIELPYFPRSIGGSLLNLKLLGEKGRQASLWITQ